LGGHLFPWLSAIGDPAGFKSNYADGCHFVFVGGSVQLIPPNADQAVAGALYTINGGEKVGEF